MNDFKVHYDMEEDILYLAKEGNEQEVVEISPGVNAEYDASGKLIGIEVFRASSPPARSANLLRFMPGYLATQRCTTPYMHRPVF